MNNALNSTVLFTVAEVQFACQCGEEGRQNSVFAGKNTDVTKTGSGERGAGDGERKSGNELSAETSTKIQNGGPKNEREKEEDKERNSCLG